MVLYPRGLMVGLVDRIHGQGALAIEQSIAA
jgi:hypothetical protein